MARAEVLLTGFEPFLDVTLNPSGEIARALDGVRIGGGAGAAGRGPDPGPSVLGRVLPVTFAGAPGAFDAALDAVGQVPRLVLALGVHRGPGFRLETRAGARFSSAKPDNDGAMGSEVTLDGPPWRASPLDVAGACADALRAVGAGDVSVSDDAGGYLCERVYRAALDRGAERGYPALFLHVPPADACPVERQTAIVRDFLGRLVGLPPRP